MFFAAKNLGQQEVEKCPEPWAFKPSQEISLQVRGDKESRQQWYQDSTTLHNFYTAIEGVNPNIRVSKENPPHAIRGFVADFDAKIPPERIDEAIKLMPLKPRFVETSLGSQFRLVFTSRTLFLNGDYDFTTLLLKNAREWLRLSILPCLDCPAFDAPSRLYANGCVWRPTGAGDIDEKALQAFFVKCGKKYNFKPGDSAQIPIDLVATAIKEKFPGFSWPSDFAEGSQGPTFWIPESVSPASAIIKAGGIFTFSAHADKPFYTWADLLGKEFVAGFLEKSVSSATAGIYFDGKSHWRQTPSGKYEMENDKGIELHMTVTARLSTKPDSSGASPKDQALEHIRKFQRIEGVGPFSMMPPGLITVDGAQYINNYNKKAVQPSGDPEAWGKNFPESARHMEWIFYPEGDKQLEHFLAWSKIIYTAAFTMTPVQVQNVICQGGPGVGKTWLGRYIIGHLLGGCIDASNFLVKGEDFNGTYFEYPMWNVDDDAPADGSQHSVRAFQAKLKKFAANNEFTSNQKYQKQVKVHWNGCIWVSCNLDFMSSRLVQFEDGVNDKLNLYSCRAEKGDFKFPDRQDMLTIRDQEAPHFAQFLLDYKIPDQWLDKERWGVKAFQDTLLANQSRQSSPSATFKEVLIGALHTYFNQNTDKKSWDGPVTSLHMLLLGNPLLHEVIKSLKLDQTNRHLEFIQKEGTLELTTSTGDWNMRIWSFKRDSVMSMSPAKPTEPVAPLPEMGSGNFQAPTQTNVLPE